MLGAVAQGRARGGEGKPGRACSVRREGREGRARGEGERRGKKKEKKEKKKRKSKDGERKGKEERGREIRAKNTALGRPRAAPDIRERDTRVKEE